MNRSFPVLIATVLLMPWIVLAACEPYPLFTMNPSATQAREADQFVESIGAVYRIVGGVPMKERLDEIGIRYIRTNLDELEAKKDHFKDLYNDLGVRIIMATSKAQIRAGANGNDVLNAVLGVGPNAMFGVEGANEPNCCAPKTEPISAEMTRTFQIDIANKIRGNATTRNIPIFSWSVYGAAHSSSFFGLVGDINAYMDGSNYHNYPRNNPPETRSLVLDRVNNVVNNFKASTKPIVMTEFCHSEGTNLEQAIYTPRFYLHMFDHGVWKSYNFTLVDIPATTCAFVDADNTPRPVFYAIKNLIALLEDKGLRFKPSSLAYTLSGSTADVEKVLLQKRDGTYYLALWVGGPISSGSRTVTLNLPTSMSSIATVRPNDGTTWTTVGSGSSVTLSVNEKVMLVRLTPAATPTISACSAAGPSCGNGICEAGETVTSCPSDCHSDTPTCTDTYLSGSAVPTGYGAAYNLFSSAKELLVKTASCTDTSLSIKAGNSDANTLVYKEGYHWSGTGWIKYNLTSPDPLEYTYYYPKSATANIPVPAGNTTKYYVAYTCLKVGADWKCGCSNATCATRSWQLQKVNKTR